jgi:tRNA 2-thiouridine synthesizing protein A
VNLIGLKCPMPLIKFKKVLVECPEERNFEVSVDDPGALSDFPAFCKKLNFAFTLVSDQYPLVFHITR